MASYIDPFGREVQIIVFKEKLEVDHLLGKFLDESHYDVLLETDADVYAPVTCEVGASLECVETNCADCKLYDTKNEMKIIAKFRKNFFSEEQQRNAYEGLRKAAAPTYNRGIAAGTERQNGVGNRKWVTPYQEAIIAYFENPVETIDGSDPVETIKQKFDWQSDLPGKHGIVWAVDAMNAAEFNFDDWVEATRKLPLDEQQRAVAEPKKYISDTRYANMVMGGIAGWYDRYPRIPYMRASSYTEKHPELFEKSFPFLQTLNDAFSKLMPWRYSNQLAESKKLDSRYLVPGTVFSTITVNKSFRTAAHYDAGDLDTGLSNLLVLSNGGNYSGCYLVAPAYRAAFNVRPGDLLLINNHEVLHGNTPLELHDKEAERISIVCYFREGMLRGGEKEYEDMRHDFVESRRLNPDHPLQRKQWNGISTHMWADTELDNYAPAKEWYDYLKSRDGGDRYLDMYHPWLKQAFEGVSLEDMFG